MLMRLFFAATLLVVSSCATVRDPCAPGPLPVDRMTVTYTHGDGRLSTVSLWYPDVPGVYKRAVFSHGALSAPESYADLLEHVAGLGLVVFAPAHIDSATMEHSVPPTPQEVWRTRKADVLALADDGAAARQLPGGIGASMGMVLMGHSSGAFTVQTLVGASAVEDPPNPPRIPAAAVVALSPPGATKGFIDADAWQRIATPQLVATGTADVLPGDRDDWRARTLAHERAQPGDQWLWVGEGVDHYFGRLIGRLDLEAAPQQAQYDDLLATIGTFLTRYGALKPEACTPTLLEYQLPDATLTRR